MSTFKVPFEIGENVNSGETTLDGRPKESSSLKVPFAINATNDPIYSDGVGDTKAFVSKDEFDSYKSYLPSAVITPENLGVLNETRAQSQSNWEKLGHSLTKMGAYAGTTFADGTIGTIAGLANLASGGDNGKTEFSDFWNNSFSKTMHDWNNLAEAKFANYQTAAESETPWYARAVGVNGGAANFWGETIIKNFGFAIGALGAGALTGAGTSALLKGTTNRLASRILANKAASKFGKTVPEMLENLAKNADELATDDILKQLVSDAGALKNINAGQQMLGATVGAMGEARIEAIGAMEDYKSEAMGRIASEYPHLSSEEVEAAAEQESLAVGNSVFLMNTAILSLSNWSQFRNAFGNGYATDKLISSKVTGNAKTGFTAGKLSKAGALKNPLSEGLEESLQYATEKGSKEYYSNPDLEGVNGVVGAIGHGLSKAFGTEEGWENFFAGAFIGTVGIPNFVGAVKNKSAKDLIAGGAYGDWETIRKGNAQAESLASSLNSIISEEVFQNNYLKVGKDLQREADKTKAVDNNDYFSYKNIESDQLISDALHFHKAGKLDSYLSYLEETKNVTPEELKEMNSYVDPTTKERKSSLDNLSNAAIKEGHTKHVQGLIDKTRKVQELSDALEIKASMKGISNVVKEQLIKTGALAEDRKIRMDQLSSEVNEAIDTAKSSLDAAGARIGEDEENLVDINEEFKKGLGRKELENLSLKLHNLGIYSEVEGKIADLLKVRNDYKTFIKTYSDTFSAEDPNAAFFKSHQEQLEMESDFVISTKENLKFAELNEEGTTSQNEDDFYTLIKSPLEGKWSLVKNDPTTGKNSFYKGAKNISAAKMTDVLQKFEDTRIPDLEREEGITDLTSEELKTIKEEIGKANAAELGSIYEELIHNHRVTGKKEILETLFTKYLNITGKPIFKVSDLSNDISIKYTLTSKEDSKTIEVTRSAPGKDSFVSGETEITGKDIREKYTTPHTYNVEEAIDKLSSAADIQEFRAEMLKTTAPVEHLESLLEKRSEVLQEELHTKIDNAKGEEKENLLKELGGVNSEIDSGEVKTLPQSSDLSIQGESDNNAKRSLKDLFGALASNELKTDAAGKRYYEYLDSNPENIYENKIRVLKPYKTYGFFPTNEDDKIEKENIKLHGEAGATLLGAVVDSNNKFIGVDGKPIKASEVASKGVFAYMPLNTSGDFGDRTYEEDTDAVNAAVAKNLEFRNKILSEVKGKGSVYLDIAGISKGVATFVKNGEAITPLEDLAPGGGDLAAWDIQVATTIAAWNNEPGILVESTPQAAKAGHTYAIHKETRQAYPVSTEKITQEQTDVIVGLFRNYAKSLVAANGKINLGSTENKQALKIPGFSKNIFDTIQDIIFWPGDNFNEQGAVFIEKEMKRNGGNMSNAMIEALKNPEYIIDTRENGLSLYPVQDDAFPGRALIINGEVESLATIDESGEVMPNEATLDKLKDYLSSQYLNVRSSYLKKDIETRVKTPFIEVTGLKFNEEGALSGVETQTHDSYTEYIYNNVKSPVVGYKAAPDTKNGKQFVNKYLRYETPEGTSPSTAKKVDDPNDERPVGSLEDLVAKKTKSSDNPEDRDFWGKSGSNIPSTSFTQAIGWYKNNMPTTEIVLRDKMIADKAVGAVINGAVHLVKGKSGAVVYHEAFHVISRYVISKESRDEVYDDFKQRYSGQSLKSYTGETKDVSEFTETEVEEFLADEFMDYMVTGTPPMVKKATTWFEKLKNFIRDIAAKFTTKKSRLDAATLFANIKGGSYATNAINTNRRISDLYKIGDKSVGFTHEVMKSMDFLFFLGVTSDKAVYDMLISGKAIPAESTMGIYSGIRAKLEKAQTMHIARGKTMWADNLQYVLDNYQDATTEHLKYLQKFSIEVKDLDTLTAEVGEKDSATRLGETSIKLSTKASASKEIKFVLASIAKQSKTAEGREQFDLSDALGLPVSIGYEYVFNLLANKLVGTKTPGEQYEILKNLSKVSGLEFLNDVIDRVGLLPINSGKEVDSNYLGKSAEEILLIAKFTQTFGKTSNVMGIQYLTEDGNYIDINTNKTRAQKRVKENWRGTNKIAEKERVKKYTTLNETIKGLDQIGISYSTYKYGTSSTEEAKAFVERAGVNSNTFKNAADRLIAIHNEGKSIFEYEQGIVGEKNNLDTIVDIELSTGIDIIENNARTPKGESVYVNGQNNYYSISVDNINAYKAGTKAMPEHLLSGYSDNSLWLLNEAPIEMEIALGTNSGNRKVENKEFHELSETDRWQLYINKGLNNKFPLIRTADGKLERFIKVGDSPIISHDVVAYSAVEGIVRNYLIDELKFSRNPANSSYSKLDKLSKTPSGIFLDILKAEKDLYQEVIDSNDISDNSVKYVTTEFLDTIQDAQEDLFKSLQDLNLITLNGGAVEAGFLNISTESKFDSKSFDRASFDTLLKSYLINDYFATVEQTKLFIGHPESYGSFVNLIKRMSGAVGPKNLLINSLKFNQAINKNLIREDGKQHSIEGRATMSWVTYQDVKVASDYMKEYKEFLTKEELSVYGKMDEADGQGIISMDEYREILFRDSAWSENLETVYQWEIQGGWKGNKVAIPSDSFFSGIAGKEITRKSLGTAVFNPLKLQSFGPLANTNSFVQGMYKLSVYPIIPSMVYNTNGTAKNKMASLYEAFTGKNNSIVNNLHKVSGVVFESANKVGTKVHPEKGIPSLYNEDGSINVSDVVAQETYYDYWGIQVNTGNKIKDKVTSVTQAAKHIVSGVYENGSATNEDSKKLTDEYFNLNSTRIAIGKKELETSTGLVNDGDSYTITGNAESLIESLSLQAAQRDQPDNIIEGIKNIGKLGIDASPNRPKIEEILYSMADSSMGSAKRRGGMKIQMASTLSESLGARKQEGGYYTSNHLKFYSFTKGDKEATGMEVMMPHFFSGLSEDLIDRDLNTLIEEGVIDKRLVENIVGFRIPTSGPNSIEAIRIKGFLPQSAGEAIILPTEIVAKAGSDFDIDKLTMYLPNFKIVKRDGKLHRIDYVEYSENPEDFDAIFERNKDSIIKNDLELHKEFITAHSYHAQAKNEIFDKRKSLIERTFLPEDAALLDVEQEGKLGEILNQLNTEIGTEVKSLQGLLILRENLRKDETNSWNLYTTLEEFLESPTDTAVQLIKASRGVDISQLTTEQLEEAADEAFEDNKHSVRVRKEYVEPYIEEYKKADSDFNKAYNSYVKENTDNELIEIDRELRLRVEPLYTAARGIFDNMSTAEKNGKTAIDNRIIEIFKSLILHPNNFSNLISPITTDSFKSTANFINSLKNKKSDKLSTTQGFLRTNMMGITERNLAARVLVGVTALHSTHHVMSQVYGFALNMGKTPIRLKGTILNKEGQLVLGSNLNSDKEMIWKYLSEAVNASVDAAKDPFILDLGFTEQTAKTFLLLLRGGVPLKTVAMFINQPIIQEYLTAKKNNDSLYNAVKDTKLSTKKIKEKVIAKFKDSGTPVKGVFTAEVLKEQFSKPTKQRQLLEEFLKYGELADTLSDAINTSTYDTTFPKNSAAGQLTVEATRKFSAEKSIINYNKQFESKGFMRPYIDAVNTTNKIASKLTKVHNLPNFQRYLEHFNKHDTTYSKQEDTVKIIDKFKADVFTYLLTNYHYSALGIPRVPMVKEQFELFKGDNAVGLQLTKMPKNNLLLENLDGNISDGIYYVNMTARKLDKLASDEMTGEWASMFDTNPEFALDLVKVAMLQTGLQNSPINFTTLIPAPIYKEMLESLPMKAIEQDTFKDYFTLFFLNNTNDKNIVPFKTDSVSSIYPFSKRFEETEQYAKATKKEQEKMIKAGAPIYKAVPKVSRNGAFSNPELINREIFPEARGIKDFKNSASRMNYRVGVPEKKTGPKETHTTKASAKDISLKEFQGLRTNNGVTLESMGYTLEQWNNTPEAEQNNILTCN